MATKDYLVEIQGDNTVFVGGNTTNPPVTWSQSNVVEAIIEPPPIQSMNIQPYDGGFGNGGMGIMSIVAAEWMNERSTSARVTSLTADVDIADTTINVTSTSAFAASGTIWINAEAMTYSGKTATTFTGCTRGSYATFAASHEKTSQPANAKTPVYGYHRSWFTRKCWVHEFDPSDPSGTKVTIAVGYIDNITFSENGFLLDMISVGQRLEDQSVGTGISASGQLRTSYNTVNNRLTRTETLDAKSKNADLIIVLDDYTRPFPYDTSAAAGQRAAIENGYFKLEDEIIEYKVSAYPAISQGVNNVGTTAFGPYITINSNTMVVLRMGDTVEFTDSATSKVVRVKVIKIDGYDLYHSGQGLAPAVASTITFPGLQLFTKLERARAGTKASEHEPGAEAKQVFARTGDHVDIILQLLYSGGESGNVYDVLPAWIGAGLPQTEIDAVSFDSLRPYGLPTTLLVEKPTSPKSLLSDLALITGGRIYVSYDGKITARREFAPYPDLDSSFTLNLDSLSSIPGWNARTDRTYNLWTWQTSQNVTMNFIVEESARQFGKRSLPSPNKNLLTNASFGTAEGVAASTLLRYAVPTPEISATIQEDSSIILEPGQIIKVTVPHFPDQDGAEGITSYYYEIIEFNPDGANVGIVLLQLPQQGNVGLLAPAGIVASVSGSDVILLSSGTTFLASSIDRIGGPLEGIVGTAVDGTEDVDWFLPGDSLELIDESTLGSATPTTAAVVVSSIDYASRTITLTTTAPAWLAAGDFVRLDDYLTCKSNIVTQAQRMTFFCWWADSAAILSGGDDAYVWGM